MRSIKPGRGQSGIGAIVSVILVIFGIFWTIMAVKAGAPVFFPIFGVFFVLLGIIQAVYHFRNATGKNRYSAFDITEDGEEPDPLEERFGTDASREKEPDGAGAAFCPYCGTRTEGTYAFCPRCGKKLPER